MAGLAFFFVVFLLIGVGKVNIDLLGRFHWGYAILSLPIVFTSFSYQGIIPTMRNYFEDDPKKVRKVILIGSSIPVIVYIVWEYLILGIVPLEGANGLLEAKKLGHTAVIPLKAFAESHWVYATGQAFAFCALTTSFLGVTLGLFDFFSDGLRIAKKGMGRVALYLLVYLPPTCIAMLFPHIFIRALGYAGGIGCVLLLGLFPVMMVWSGRYRKKLDRSHEQLKGGRWILTLLAVFVFFELIVELIAELHL
jgi:tyrosine-specific transport protein